MQRVNHGESEGTGTPRTHSKAAEGSNASLGGCAEGVSADSAAGSVKLLPEMKVG